MKRPGKGCDGSLGLGNEEIEKGMEKWDSSKSKKAKKRSYDGIETWDETKSSAVTFCSFRAMTSSVILQYIRTGK